MYETIRYEVSEPVAIVTLDRPERLNAWTSQMAEEVQAALSAAHSDPRVVVIVLTGEGRGFCAGADLGDLDGLSSGSADIPRASSHERPGDAAMGASFRGTYTYLMSLQKPVIAAINGGCAGMAVPIALACDIRFASERAVFTTAFARRGLIAEWGVAWLLPRLIGTGHAMDLLLSARRVDAAEAERMGLVNRVLPHAELLPFTLDYAREMGTQCSPSSLRVIKQQVYESLERSLGDDTSQAHARMLESFKRGDFREGVRAFLEKRPPQFSRLQ